MQPVILHRVPTTTEVTSSYTPRNENDSQLAIQFGSKWLELFLSNGGLLSHCIICDYLLSANSHWFHMLQYRQTCSSLMLAKAIAC